MERNTPGISRVEDGDGKKFWEAWNSLSPNQQGFLTEQWQLRQDWLDGVVDDATDQRNKTNEICGRYGLTAPKMGTPFYNAWILGRPELKSEQYESKR